jgi:acid stress chaperone HdeB
MRTFRALAVTFALFAFVPAAQAQKIELSKFSCKDFIALNKDSIATVWSWLYGYYADPDVDPMVDLADLAKRGQQLSAYCAANPTVDVITAAEPIYERR